MDSGASVVGKAVHKLENGGASSDSNMPGGRVTSDPIRRDIASKSASRGDHKRLRWTTVPIGHATASTARKYPYADPKSAARSELLPPRVFAGQTAHRVAVCALTIRCLLTPKGPAQGRLPMARKTLKNPELRNLATLVRGLVDSEAGQADRPVGMWSYQVEPAP